jgi:uncharacterized protein (TIGR02246 family)
MSATDPILRRLADLDAIRDLARRYAHCVWQKDAAGVAELFAEDGVMDMGNRPPIVGRATLRAEYEQTLPAMELNPFVHNHVIDLQGDRASGTCYLDLRATMNGTSMIGHGFYRDEYVRVGDTWKFRSRRLYLAYFVPLRQGWAEAKGDS